jgi:hypothetical protein
MNLIEMRKSVWKLSENDFGAAAVHLAHVVLFKGAHTALCHP